MHESRAPGASVTHDDDNYEAFPPGLQKMAAASGILFVILLIISIALQPELPDMDASPDEFLSFVTDDKDDLELSSLFQALAGIEWLWFVGVVTGALSRAESLTRGFTRVTWVWIAGTVLALGLILVSAGLTLAPAVTPEQTDATVAQAFEHASVTTWSFAPVGF